ncbi:MAG: hypothetical protein ABSH41_18090 [Syntrophobacteraceae bacterium]|jgi:predicted nucleic-acid-binding Zn-ribbon protein
MIMPNIPGTVKCPQCGSFNIATKWSFTTVVSWLGKLLGVPMVRIYEKKCMQCGREFQVFRK